MGTDFGFTDQESVWNDTRQKAPNRFSGASYEKLKANRRDGLQWPVKETGTVRLHAESFRTEDGRITSYNVCYTKLLRPRSGS